MSSWLAFGLGIGFALGLLIFVFYLSLPIRGGRDHSLVSNC